MFLSSFLKTNILFPFSDNQLLNVDAIPTCIETFFFYFVN